MLPSDGAAKRVDASLKYVFPPRAITTGSANRIGRPSTLSVSTVTLR